MGASHKKEISQTTKKKPLMCHHLLLEQQGIHHDSTHTQYL
jgi:hypothetical protein